MASIVDSDALASIKAANGVIPERLGNITFTAVNKSKNGQQQQQPKLKEEPDEEPATINNASGGGGAAAAPQESSEFIWLESHTNLLIQAFAQHAYLRSVMRKKEFFDAVVEWLAKNESFYVSSEDAMKKWNNLSRTYRRIRENMKKNVSQSHWPYFQAFSEAVALVPSTDESGASADDSLCAFAGANATAFKVENAQNHVSPPRPKKARLELQEAADMLGLQVEGEEADEDGAQEDEEEEDAMHEEAGEEAEDAEAGTEGEGDGEDDEGETVTVPPWAAYVTNVISEQLQNVVECLRETQRQNRESLETHKDLMERLIAAISESKK